MEDLIAILQGIILTAGLRIVGAVIIVIIGFKLIGALVGIIKKGPFMNRVELSVRAFITGFISISLKIVLLLTVAAVLGVPMTNMVALLGSAGLAIGLSLQGSLTNLAGGLIILTLRPFKIGDYIETSAGAGTVKMISIFYTTLLTIDNRRVIIPNGAISNDSILNYTAEETRRIDIEYCVAFDSDIDTVREILLNTASSHELSLSDPAPFARFVRHRDCALVFILRVWCKSSDYWTVNFDLVERLKKEFDKAGIITPYPQVDVHMVKNNTEEKEI